MYGFLCQHYAYRIPYFEGVYFLDNYLVLYIILITLQVDISVLFFYAIAYMDSWDPSHVQKMVNTLHTYVVFSTPYKNKNLDIFICTVFFSGETKKWNLETFVYMVFLVDIILSVFFVLCMISWEFFRVQRWIPYFQYCVFSTVNYLESGEYRKLLT